MILRRLGNKKKIAFEIIKHFPDHKIYIEPFFGAGGMFFQKPKAKHNIVNDLDSDVFNLFQVVMNQKEELEKAFYIMPIHLDLWNYWKENKETESVKKALRFLMISNFSLLGRGTNLEYSLRSRHKNQFYKYIDLSFDKLNDVKFNNTDFRNFFNELGFNDVDYGKPSGERNMTFIYNDPPYLSTMNNYSNNFTEADSIDLFNCLEETGCKYAMSEFDHPFILDQAKQRGLNIIIIGERQNLKNRRTEILVTNYQNTQSELF